MLFDGERALALGHATTSQVEEIEEFKEAFDAFVHSACDDHEKIGQKEIDEMNLECRGRPRRPWCLVAWSPTVVGTRV